MPFIEPKEFSDSWAYDLHKDVIRRGEIRDEEVISQSIEMILATSYNERLFNLSFGSPLWTQMFENMNKSTAEDLLNGCIAAIKRWEDRIRLLENSASITVFTDQNAIRLSLPYIILRNGKTAVWEKKIFA